MARPRNDANKTDTPEVPQTIPVAPERLQGLPEGESNINTEYPTTADGLEVKGPHNIVDTTPLGDNSPVGDARAGVFADPPVPGIDPASNIPVEMMDGRAPRPATETRTAGQTGPDYQPRQHKGGVQLRLNTKYWPKQRPDDLHPDTEYVLHPGQEVSLPSEEAMDLLERGHAERVNKRG
jgi:hypothetical protein